MVETTLRLGLLRLEARWSTPPAMRPARSQLIAHYGSRRLRLAPLPGSTDVRSGGPWRAGFAVPRDVLSARSAFLLDGGDLGLMRLPAPERGESGGGAARPGRRRILIVGHSPFERALLRRLFERSSCEVADVDTGEAAVLEMACTGCVDAVLTADVLADGSGVALVRWVRTRQAHQCRNVPVLVLSADGSDDFKVRAYDAGADMVVAKPVDLGVLHRKLLAISRSAARHDLVGASRGG